MLVAALVPLVVVLALVPFHHHVRFASGAGRAEGACPAPMVSALRRSGDGAGLWTATIRGERVDYFPRASKPPVQPPPGANIAVPQSPCHTAARVRIVSAAVVLVILSLVPSLGDRRGRVVARSAMMAA